MIAADEAALRRAIFRRALPLIGRIISPSQIRDKDPDTGHQFHRLIEGIYKPRWSRYALAITSMYHLFGPWAKIVLAKSTLIGAGLEEGAKGQAKFQTLSPPA